MKMFWPFFACVALLTPISAVADGTLADELASKVLIKRDNFGVPHILGETEEAVWLAPELEHLPVRIQVSGLTLELAELTGIERASATAPAAPKKP